MDGLSLLVGGTLGILAGWAFSSASHKQRDASRKQSRAFRAKEEMTKKKGELKNNKDSSLSDAVQGFLLNLLGIGLIFVMGVILFSSLF